MKVRGTKVDPLDRPGQNGELESNTRLRPTWRNPMVTANTRRIGWILLSLMILVHGVAVSPAAAQDPAKPSKPTALVENFPPGTLAVMRIKDVARYRDWLSTSPLAHMVRDPEVQPLWELILGKAKMLNSMAAQKVGVDFLDLLDQIKGEAAIAVTKFMMNPRPSVGVMLLLDCREGAEAFKQHTDALLKLVPEGTFETTDREITGVPVKTFVPIKGASGRRDPLQYVGPIHLAWLGSALLISNDKSGFDKFIQASKSDQPANTLGQSKNWRDTMEKLGGAGDFTMFVNTQVIAEIIEAFSPMMGESIGAVVSALGLDQFPAIGASAFLKPNGVMSRSILRYTGDGKSGIGSLLAFRKSDLTIPNWVPEDAMSVVIVNYDFSKAFSGLLGMMQEAGDEPYEEMQEFLDNFHAEFGMSLQDDLIGALAGPIILVSYEATGAIPSIRSIRGGSPFNRMGLQNSTLMGVRIRNRKAIEQFMEIAEQFGFEATEYMGATIFRAPGMNGDEGPVAEAAITDNYVLLGLGTTSVVRPTLQRMGGQDSGFAGIKGVRRALENLPREGVGLAVSNYGRAISSQLNMVKAMVKVFGAKATDLANLSVPSSTIFEKYCGYGAGMITMEPGVGLVSESFWELKRPE